MSERLRRQVRTGLSSAVRLCVVRPSAVTPRMSESSSPSSPRDSLSSGGPLPLFFVTTICDFDSFRGPAHHDRVRGLVGHSDAVQFDAFIRLCSDSDAFAMEAMQISLSEVKALADRRRLSACARERNGTRSGRELPRLSG